MSRAKWKGPYVTDSLLKICKKQLSNKKQHLEIFTYSRKSSIIPEFVGFTFNVHNGNRFSKVKINEKMIGHKLGEFSPTRKKFSFKKKK